MQLLRSFTTFSRPGQDVPIKYAYLALGRLRGFLLDCDNYNRTFDDCMDPVIRVCTRAMISESLLGLGLDASEPVGLDDLTEMIAMIQEACAEDIRIAKARLDQGSFSYEDLAELFLPGTKVVGPAAALHDAMGYTVRSSGYQEEKSLFGAKLSFSLELEFVASVGDRFGIVRFQELIGMWNGQKAMSVLFYQPINAAFLERFTLRGKTYEKIALGANFLQCAKGMFFSGSVKGTSDDGRVMVDIMTAIESGKKPASGTDTGSYALDVFTGRYAKAVHQGRLRKQGKGDPAVQKDEATGVLIIDNMCFVDRLPEDWLWNCWPVASAYHFSSKVWGQVMVEGLSPVQWQEQAWDNLVLPSDRKALLKAIVRRQREVSEIDIIKGKGEGTTFLLYGPPGTGKTLTAEAMSELFHKPLYVLSAGEMGTVPETLEEKFSDALRICAKWDCLCLVDEADTFLEQRKGSDIVRNALVCVMLRLLEYHPGVLFLTSNKVKGIDTALQSRLTMAFKYEPLDFDARHKVWTFLLNRVGRHGQESTNGFMAQFDVDVLAQAPLNGRQIKNCVRLSQALAVDNGQVLSQSVLLTTLATICTFQRDLQDGADDEYLDAADTGEQKLRMTAYMSSVSSERARKSRYSCINGISKCLGA